jgi:hypothetical protein
MTRDPETMLPLAVGDTEIEYSDRGTGEPLVLVHAGVFGDWFEPLRVSPTLDCFRVIRVHRPGYGSATPSRHMRGSGNDSCIFDPLVGGQASMVPRRPERQLVENSLSRLQKGAHLPGVAGCSRGRALSEDSLSGSMAPPAWWRAASQVFRCTRRI